MIKNFAKSVLESNVGQRFFKKFYYLSIEMDQFHPDVEKEFLELKTKCLPHTMTSVDSLYYTYRAVKYVVANDIPGDFVECGVWKGGNTMMVAHTLMALGESSRRIFLYDTFEGMSEPTEKDISYREEGAVNEWNASQKNGYNDWCYSPIDEVRKNLESTGYPLDKIVFVKGKVEDTIPGKVPDHIAILRLDTDWYESTFHELLHLFPLLSKGGFLIVDDYGYWKGAREAVDKYFEEHKVNIFMNRLDNSARGGIKF